MYNSNKYFIITKIICNYFGLTENNLIDILKQKENKYLLLLLMKKYKCIEDERIIKLLDIRTRRSLIYSLKKAEEKLLIDRYFRETYFEIEQSLLK